MERVELPWMAGRGAISGVPVLRIVFRQTHSAARSIEISGNDLCDRLEELVGNAKHKPGWVYFCGDDNCADSQLHNNIQMKLKLRVYAEVTGTRPLTDRDRHHLLFDHVCLCPRVGEYRIGEGILFHSVMVHMPRLRKDFEGINALSAHLDRWGANVYRYLLPAGAAPTFAELDNLKRIPKGWRFTGSALSAKAATEYVAKRGQVMHAPHFVLPPEACVMPREVTC